MKTVTGFVCLLQVHERNDDRNFLYEGRPHSISLFNHQTASGMLKNFRKNPPVHGAVCLEAPELTLTYAEKIEEYEPFKKARDLVVLSYTGNDFQMGSHTGLYGPITNGRPSSPGLPCAPFSENGLVTFRTFREAEAVARKVAGRVPGNTTIGTLTLVTGPHR